MAPSRKLSYQGAWGLLPLASLSVIPRDCYLFRLNESHKKMVAKTGKLMNEGFQQLLRFGGSWVQMEGGTAALPILGFE